MGRIEDWMERPEKDLKVFSRMLLFGITLVAIVMVAFMLTLAYPVIGIAFAVPIVIYWLIWTLRK